MGVFVFARFLKTILRSIQSILGNVLMGIVTKIGRIVLFSVYFSKKIIQINIPSLNFEVKMNSSPKLVIISAIHHNCRHDKPYKHRKIFNVQKNRF